MRQTWEYRIQRLGPAPTLQDVLNQFGAEGWELVAVESGRTQESPKIMYFKRPK
jgi:hypothetical protein